ncbi:MAG: hypothetical protein ABI237_06760 [Ginsengibacter sp.]
MKRFIMKSITKDTYRTHFAGTASVSSLRGAIHSVIARSYIEVVILLNLMATKQSPH